MRPLFVAFSPEDGGSGSFKKVDGSVGRRGEEGEDAGLARLVPGFAGGLHAEVWGVIYHDGDVDCFLFIVSFLLSIRISDHCIIQWKLSESSSLPFS